MERRMHVVLFEDHMVDDTRPVTLSRPAFAVSIAASCLYDIAARNATGISAVIRRYLRDTAAAAFDLLPAPEGGPALCINASLVPSVSLMERLVKAAGHGGNFLVQTDARVAAAYFERLPAGIGDQDEQTITAFLLGHQARNMHDDLPLVALPHDLVRYHQKYFLENVERRARDLKEIQPGLFVGENVKIHPTAVIDASEGPVVLEDNVSVGPFALFIGPVAVGHSTKIIERASIKEQVQIGHMCKIGGEVECSSIEPYTNKQHHGFLGHSYVGSWVNMGAGTSNSDLKNTYGEVTILHRGNKINTGMQFLGSIIGDFSKTAINTSIFTGKIIGVSSYLYGFIGTNVPSFTNYARTFGQQTEYVLDAAVKTQARMFARRNVTQTPADAKLLSDIFELTRDERLMSTDQVMF